MEYLDELVHAHSLTSLPCSYIQRLEMYEVSDKETGLEVIKLEFILRLKIKHNDWLLADTCPQSANHCALF